MLLFLQMNNDTILFICTFLSRKDIHIFCNLCKNNPFKQILYNTFHVNITFQLKNIYDANCRHVYFTEQYIYTVHKKVNCSYSDLTIIKRNINLEEIGKKQFFKIVSFNNPSYVSYSSNLVCFPITNGVSCIYNMDTNTVINDSIYDTIPIKNDTIPIKNSKLFLQTEDIFDHIHNRKIVDVTGSRMHLTNLPSKKYNSGIIVNDKLLLYTPHSTDIYTIRGTRVISKDYISYNSYIMFFDELYCLQMEEVHNEMENKSIHFVGTRRKTNKIYLDIPYHKHTTIKNHHKIDDNKYIIEVSTLTNGYYIIIDFEKMKSFILLKTDKYKNGILYGYIIGNYLIVLSQHWIAIYLINKDYLRIYICKHYFDTIQCYKYDNRIFIYTGKNHIKILKIDS